MTQQRVTVLSWLVSDLRYDKHDGVNYDIRVKGDVLELDQFEKKIQMRRYEIWPD